MSTIAPNANPESNPRVKAVFDDIRATRKTGFINNLWQRLAFDPALPSPGMRTSTSYT